MTTFLFYFFAILTVVAAAGVIAARSPIYSAMSLVGTFFSLAAIYALLLAHTIAVLQVLVYAGAIMVLFLFVIMLLSLGESVGPAKVRNSCSEAGRHPGPCSTATCKSRST